MTGIITLNIAGTDTGPFNLYSNINGYISAFAVNITRAQLLAGYPTDAIPSLTTIIRIMSIGDCTNYIDVPLPTCLLIGTGVITIPPPTTTTTTTLPLTTTTTSTSTTTIPPICYSWQSAPYEEFFSITYIDCNGIEQSNTVYCTSGICRYPICARSIVSSTETMNNLGICGGTTTSTTTVIPTTTTTTTTIVLDCTIVGTAVEQ